MEFNSQICTTKEQSERLLALGLKEETADMMYCKTASGELITAKDYDYLEHLDFPAWSLHRLLCLLPREYIYDIDFQRIMQDFIFRSQDMYDEAIGCIETLIKEGYFNKEYLEE
jgi:hypothetical protein